MNLLPSTTGQYSIECAGPRMDVLTTRTCRRFAVDRYQGAPRQQVEVNPIVMLRVRANLLVEQLLTGFFAREFQRYITATEALDRRLRHVKRRTRWRHDKHMRLFLGLFLGPFLSLLLHVLERHRDLHYGLVVDVWFEELLDVQGSRVSKVPTEACNRIVAGSMSRGLFADLASPHYEVRPPHGASEK